MDFEGSFAALLSLFLFVGAARDVSEASMNRRERGQDLLAKEVERELRKEDFGCWDGHFSISHHFSYWKAEFRRILIFHLE